MKDENPSDLAARLGFREERCPRCIDGLPPTNVACVNCGGTGRVWIDTGGNTLSDSGLRRLRLSPR